jgi:flagellar protein FliS
MDGKVGAYQQSSILGKSPLDLVIQVYDGAIGAFEKAGEALRKEDFNVSRDQLEKARKFLTHLYTTLDMERGGEIASHLSRLYAFVISQTHIIEATKELRLIDDNVNILKNLRSGWAGLKQNQTAGANKGEYAAQTATEQVTVSA